ncbi:MAG: O-antigen ligase family protein, partial [Gammaproteobacteria bacterium]|nr:O-antigen ligase family protein [Gammaproteobacteria bacterium]
TLDLQYKQARSAEDILTGSIRGGNFRAMGVFDSSNALGGLIAAILPFAFISLQAFYSTFRAVLSATVILLAVPSAVFTGSRTSIGFTLVIIAWYVYRYIARGLNKGGRNLLLAFFIFLGLLAILPFLGDIIETILFGDYEGSTMARYLQYGYTFVALTESPFFGYGYARSISEIVNIKPLDSYYMRMALEGGLVAIACVFYSMRKAYVLAGSFAARSTDKVVLAAAQAMRVVLVTFSFSMAVQSMPQIRLYSFLTIGLVMAIGCFIVDAPGEGEA